MLIAISAAFLFAVAAVAAVVVLRRRTAAARLSAQQAVIAADERRILDIQPGDIIDTEGVSLLVDATLLYDEEGTVWAEHRSMDTLDGPARWLTVCDDDALEIALFEVLPPGSIEVQRPGPDQLVVGDVTFRLKERGHARVRKRDKHGLRDHGQCDYADYLAADATDRARLSVEWWGQQAEVAIGHAKSEDDIMILPGSP